MLYLDQRYLVLLSGRFRNFAQKDRLVYNWSCHSCGDSKKDRRKARAYAYEHKGKLRWKCHNCSDGGSVYDLIKDQDQALFEEYLLEKFHDSDRGREAALSEQREKLFDEVAKSSSVQFECDDPFDGLKCVMDLPADHPAVQLCAKRRIPKERLPDLYHADGFYKWAHGLRPDKYSDERGDEPRFVIPFRRFRGMLGFQGRAYGESKVKYISVRLDTEQPLIYGWNFMDGVGNVYAFEGPIDSMFLPNGVAVAGGSIHTGLMSSGIPKDVCVVVSDNEPRNPQIVKTMMKAAADGWRICVWPEGIQQKDVNDMVLSGMSADHVKNIIDENTVSGFHAEVVISSWKKVRI